MKFNDGDKVLAEATIENVDIENGQYYVRVSDHRMWLKRDKIHSVNTATKTYEDGLREAWETARKIGVDESDGGLSREEIERIFGNYFTADIFDNYEPQEAFAKIAEWEKKEIHVNDEVIFSGKIGVVFNIAREICDILDSSANAYGVNKRNLTKTGRTIDIAGLLAQIGGAE